MTSLAMMIKASLECSDERVTMNTKEIDYSLASLSKEEIHEFLQKNDEDHYKNLSDLVDINIYAEKLSVNASHFTLYEKEKLVGFCPSYFNDDISKIGYISIISILKGYRRIGLGGKLIHHILEYGRQKHFKEIVVKPDCNNLALIGFFQKYGFIMTEKIKDRCLLKYILKDNI